MLIHFDAAEAVCVISTLRNGPCFGIESESVSRNRNSGFAAVDVSVALLRTNVQFVGIASGTGAVQWLAAKLTFLTHSLGTV